MSSGLKALLTRAECDEMASFNTADLHRWKLALSAQPLLKNAPTPSFTRCPGCERDCTMEVAWHPVTSQPFIVCDKPQDLGRIWLDNTDLEQWRLDFPALAACVATAIQGTPQEAIESRLYYVGTFDGHGVCMAHGLNWPDSERLTAHAYLQRSTTILLTLAPTTNSGLPCTVLPLADLLSDDGETWRINTQALRATLPDDTHTPEYAFRLKGQFWTLAYEGKTAHIKNTKGMGYLHTLIRRPHEDIAAMELAAPDAVASLRANRQDRQEMADELSRKAAMRQLKQLEEENPLSPDIPKLRAYLSSTTHGGKAKSFTNSNEAARASVKQAIDRAITEIRKHLPDMAEHLTASIRTGALCVYAPAKKIAWG